MNKKLSLILATMLAVSCATERPDASGKTGGSWHVQDATFPWLLQQQRADGYWGEDDHRVILTSLATLAFLAQGLTPASEQFGKCIEDSLRALLRDSESETQLSQQDDAILTWCLTEAYALTQIPSLREAVKVQANRLNFKQPTPWHAFAAQSLSLTSVASDIGEKGLITILDNYPSEPNSMHSQATHLFVARHAGETGQAETYSETVRRLGPENWKSQESPLLTAVMQSRAMVWSGGWLAPIYKDMLDGQTRKGNLSWWTVEKLGVEESSLENFSHAEKDIYATCMALLTLAPPGRFPAFQPKEVEQYNNGEEDDDILIDLL